MNIFAYVYDHVIHFLTFGFNHSDIRTLVSSLRSVTAYVRMLKSFLMDN